MGKQPLVVVAIGLACGILLREYTVWSFGMVVAAVILLVLLALVLIFGRLRGIYLAVGLPLLFLLLGVVLHDRHWRIPEWPPLEGENEMVFKLSKKLNTNAKYNRYEVLWSTNERRVPLVISVPLSEAPLDYEHYYKARGKVYRVKGAGNSYQFDYARFLSRQGIYFQAYVSGRVSSALREDLSLAEKVRQKRLEALARIDGASLSRHSSAFLKGVILADRTGMDEEVVRDFRRSGLAHLLAISGTHIGIIFGVFYFLFLRIGVGRYRRYAVMGSLVMVWLFAFFIGWGSSVLRACIMLTSYFGYMVLQRKSDGVHALGLAALVILLLDTNQLFHVGFQLSFAAVSGILGLARPLLRLFPASKNSFLKFCYSAAAVTVAAQLATLPLLLFHFHQFSVVSFGANFLMFPFAQTVIIASLVMALGLGLGLKWLFLEKVYDVVIGWFLAAVRWFGNVEAGINDSVSFSLGETVLAFCVLGALYRVLRFGTLKNRLILWASVLTLVLGRTAVGIYHQTCEELVVHSHYSGRLFSVKTGGNVVVWVDDRVDWAAAKERVIKPYLHYRRVGLGHCVVKRMPEHARLVRWRGRVYDLSAAED
ncbi:ComEC/Rec2 family competence protein [Bergeyella sp. RCAD1439]|uniref:ComEC/Rec2 family competence protein n=1 Tax=Bergeyella anatis TaxID=3113737 RepID=UPI002E1954F1|nr:ComEC/Rec2 family competence protein [Bergeyella sp. RCAD1439]